MFAYIIAGLVIIGYCCIQEFRSGEITIETLRDPGFWIVSIGVVIAWPILVASAIIDIIKLVMS